MTTSRDSLDSILEDYKGGIKSAWNNNYGENVWNAEEQADREAKQAIHQLITAEIIAELERLQKIHPDGRWKVIDSRIKELKAKETQL